jgi:hypothetical protein
VGRQFGSPDLDSEPKMDVERELAKLRYHVRRLADAIDPREHPEAAMVVQLDWSEDDVERATDIFAKYAQLLQSGRSIHGLEKELKDAFGIVSYQTIKPIVLGFWRLSVHPDVCVEYAKQNECREFREILDEARNPV